MKAAGVLVLSVAVLGCSGADRRAEPICSWAADAGPLRRGQLARAEAVCNVPVWSGLSVPVRARCALDLPGAASPTAEI